MNIIRRTALCNKLTTALTHQYRLTDITFSVKADYIEIQWSCVPGIRIHPGQDSKLSQIGKCIIDGGALPDDVEVVYNEAIGHTTLMSLPVCMRISIVSVVGTSMNMGNSMKSPHKINSAKLLFHICATFGDLRMADRLDKGVAMVAEYPTHYTTATHRLFGLNGVPLNDRVSYCIPSRVLAMDVVDVAEYTRPLICIRICGSNIRSKIQLEHLYAGNYLDNTLDISKDLHTGLYYDQYTNAMIRLPEGIVAHNGKLYKGLEFGYKMTEYVKGDSIRFDINIKDDSDVDMAIALQSLQYATVASLTYLRDDLSNIIACTEDGSIINNNFKYIGIVRKLYSEIIKIIDGDD